MKKKEMYKLLGNLSLIVLIVGIIVFLLRNSLKDIVDQLFDTDSKILLIITLFGLVYLFLEGKNISVMAQQFQPAFKWRNGFFCACYVAFCRVVTFGTGTLISEIVFYKRKNLKTSTAIGVSTIHLIMYKVSIIVFSVASVLFHIDYLMTKQPSIIVLILLGVVLTLLIISALLLLASSAKFHSWVIKKLNQYVKKEKWRIKIDNMNQQIYSLREAIDRIAKDKKVLTFLFLLNLFKLVFLYSLPYIILRQNHEVFFFVSTAMISFVTILAGVLPAPAGIGSFEFVYMLLFRPVFGTVDSFASLLLYRFATYVLPFMIGLLYAAVLKKRQLNQNYVDLKKERTEKS